MNKNKALLVAKNMDAVFSALCLIALIAITFMGVIMRYLVGKPFAWQEEVQLALILWVVFLGGSAAFRAHSHIAIDIVVDVFPRAVQMVLRIVVFLVVMYVLSFMAYNGSMLVEQFIRAKKLTFILKFPSSYVYASIPVGCALMMINAVYEFIVDLLRPAKPREGAAA